MGTSDIVYASEWLLNGKWITGRFFTTREAAEKDRERLSRLAPARVTALGGGKRHGYF